MGLPETYLIKKILAGEKETFGQILDQYQRSIFNLAYRMLGNREDALDVSQETFLRAFRSLGSFDLERPFSPWIHRIATNLCINLLKKRKIRVFPLVSEKEGPGIKINEIADPGPIPEEQTVMREEQNELFKAISELPEKYRVPLILRHLHHFTYDEIGEILNKPPGTVKTWIFRGRNILKDIFKQSQKFEEGEGR